MIDSVGFDPFDNVVRPRFGDWNMHLHGRTYHGESRGKKSRDDEEEDGGVEEDWTRRSSGIHNCCQHPCSRDAVRRKTAE